MITNRDETTDDHDAVRELTAAAFASSEYGHQGEADLVDQLRATSTRHLSIVACSEDEIVGHILFTPVEIRTAKLNLQGMGLAPMSVAPRHQKMGVGTSLIINGLERLFADECPFVVVLGHPQYYPRFGFQPAAQLDVSHGFTGIPQDVFFVHCNPNVSPSPKLAGRAYYQAQFGLQHEEK